MFFPKRYTRLERIARDEHSSLLLLKLVNYSRKKFYRIGPWFFSFLSPSLEFCDRKLPIRSDSTSGFDICRRFGGKFEFKSFSGFSKSPSGSKSGSGSGFRLVSGSSATAKAGPRPGLWWPTGLKLIFLKFCPNFRNRLFLKGLDANSGNEGCLLECPWRPSPE